MIGRAPWHVLAGTLILAITLVVGVWVWLIMGSILGLGLAAGATVGLIGMATWRTQATKAALWMIVEGTIAYVTGAWFWHRDS